MRYLMTFSYDGSKYNGYQKQPKASTIQETIEAAMYKINSNNPVGITASGRTDSKVHAVNQKAHFDMEKEFDCWKLRHAINSILPSDIFIKNIEKVDEKFHARFDVTGKQYIYKINIGEYDPILKDYIYQYNRPIDIEKMKEAIKLFEGTHDFTTFTKANDETDNYIRTINATDISVNENIVTLVFIGTGFLRYMVRNIVGALLEINEGVLEVQDIPRLFKLKDRSAAGITANPEGLYLNDVYY